MRSLPEIQNQLSTSPETGLNAEGVAKSRAQFGANHLTPLPRQPLWKKFLEKFDEPIIKILLAAALLSMIVDLFKPPFEADRYLLAGIAVGITVVALVGAFVFRREWAPSLLFLSAMILFPVGLVVGHASYDGLAVMVAVILATGVAFLSEYKSDREFEILNTQKESIEVKVFSGGDFHTIPLEDVVVGDVILLEMGDELPADGRLIKANELYVDQSLMTGESEPVRKQVCPPDDAAEGPEQPGCLYRGTQVVDGSGTMIVTEVGDATALGQIARHLSTGGAEETSGAETEQQRIQRKLSVSKELTPLQHKLEKLAGLISKVGYIAAVAIFLALLIRGLIKGEVRWPNSEPRTPALGRHGSNVDLLAFSHDGNRLASAAWDVVGEDLVGEIKVWDPVTGQEMRTMRGHQDQISALALSPNGKYMASAGKDVSLLLWETASGRSTPFPQGTLDDRPLQPDEGHNKPVIALAFSPDNKRLATASSDGTCKIWDANNAKVLLTFFGHAGEVLGIAFSQDGKLVASSGNDRRIRLWDPVTGKEREFPETFWEQVDAKTKVQRKEPRLGIRNPEEKPVVRVALSPDGKRVASTTFGKKGQQGPWEVRVWNADTGQEEKVLRGQTGHDALFIAFTDDNRLIVASAGYGATLFDLSIAQEKKLTEGDIPQNGPMAFTSDGQGRAWTEDKRLRLVIAPDDFGAVLLASGSALLGYFMYMVIIIVVAVPEGLPMSVTVSLALAMRKMTRANSLVRQLVACETIGSATVICSDKTGTLTQNKMQVAHLCWDGQTIERDTGPWELQIADFRSQIENPIPQSAIFNLRSAMILNAAVNSTANLEIKEGVLVPIGNSTEGALLQWLHEAHLDYRKLRGQFDTLYQNHFSSERKRMTTVIRYGTKLVALVKGAPELLLEHCQHYLAADGRVVLLTPALRDQINDLLRKAAVHAMRTLAFAYAYLPENQAADEDSLHAARENIEKELVYVGFTAIRDPLRPDVKDAMAECREAGIDVKMVTGDNIETARAIGAEIGLLEKPDALVMTSPEFNALSDEGLKEKLPRLTILARARPLDKYRLVRLLQEQGEVVAVTGDGTNDAPALKKADVGLAMGRAGTEVAKEASKIVILDDAFSTIVKAVHWGHTLFENIQRFIQFQLTINISALAIAFLGPFLGVKPPFTILQLLWINVIMDTLASIALCSEPPRPGLMKQKPKRREDSILTPAMRITIFTTAAFFIVVMILLLLALENNWWFLADPYGRPSKSFPELTYWQVAVFFSVFVFFQVWNEINCRTLSPETSGFHGLLRNPVFLSIVGLIVLGQILIVTFGVTVFEVAPLGPWTWLAIAAFTASVAVYAEIVRQIRLARIREAEPPQSLSEDLVEYPHRPLPGDSHGRYERRPPGRGH